MALPPGFLDELRGRVPLSRLVGRRVTWDPRKSNPGKGDHWAPCPFHQEKTASFHVDDRKGFYYCFGCQAKGDAIDFLREAENLGFMEAVEVLAREAGMQMPAADPRARAAAEARAGLAEVMEEAVRFYRLELRTARAQPARDLLDRRGLGEAARARFEIGWAPEERTRLLDTLTARGIPLAQLVAAGLVRPPEAGNPARDRFRGRIMFPIRDARGRPTGFGARAVRPGQEPKYLNSPETPLFDKGRSLYNHGPAREAAARAGSVIVAEGYVDVIALVMAGFEHAVAPLGTAVTEDQLRLLWRMADEPVIALDGDAAGLRAGLRLADLALPLLEPGRSLRFATLPPGQDPDDLIRAGGAEAMRGVLAAARPLVDLLWTRAVEDRPLDTPERRAAFDRDLRALLARIGDPAVRAHYEAEFRTRRAALLAPRKQAAPERRAEPVPARARGTPRRAAPGGASAAARASLLARADGAGPDLVSRIREAVILYGCLNHPALALDRDAALMKTRFRHADLGRLRDALLLHLAESLGAAEPRAALRARLEAETGRDPEAWLVAIGHVRIHPHLGPAADPALAARALDEEIAKQAAETGWEVELAEAAEELARGQAGDPGWRLAEAAAARDRARRGIAPPDGPAADRDSAPSPLQGFIIDQIWVKKKG